MPTCAKCQTVFPNRVTLNGERKTLVSRRFCLTCSPWGKHNTRQLDRLEIVPEGLKRCSGPCGRLLPVEDFTLLKGGRRRVYCLACDRQRQRLRQQKIKKEAVEYKGGECVGCGYNRCLSVLDFHHLNPAEKDFRVSLRKGTLDAVVKAELDKCVLVCSNCHREIHAGVRTIVDGVAHLVRK